MEKENSYNGTLFSRLPDSEKIRSIIETLSGRTALSELFRKYEMSEAEYYFWKSLLIDSQMDY